MPTDATIIIPALAGTLASIQGCCSARLGNIAGRGFTSATTIVSSSVMAGTLFWVLHGFKVAGVTADFEAGRRGIYKHTLNTFVLQ
jgi:hypothetical protein